MKRAINEKGITLVALVITVVVLLILAGVAISTINETGIIAKSNDAAAKFNASQVNESENLIGYEDLIDKYGGTVTPGKELIKFTIDDVEYTAEKGMTWVDWVSSSYNTGNWKIYIEYNDGRYEGYFYPNGYIFVTVNSENKYVYEGDRIVWPTEGTIYYTEIKSNCNYNTKDTWYSYPIPDNPS